MRCTEKSLTTPPPKTRRSKKRVWVHSVALPRPQPFLPVGKCTQWERWRERCAWVKPTMRFLPLEQDTCAHPTFKTELSKWTIGKARIQKPLLTEPETERPFKG